MRCILSSAFCLHCLNGMDRYSVNIIESSSIESGIHIINVLLVQFFPQNLERLSKALEVNNLTLPKEFNHIIYVGIITQAQNVIVSGSCFLLCCNCVKTTALKT